MSQRDSDERKEPQLSPLLSLDGEETLSARVRAATEQPSLAPVANLKKTSTIGLWIAIVLLALALAGLAYYAYIESLAISSRTQVFEQRIEALASTSDQIGRQLSRSGGTLEQTRTSVEGQLDSLKQSVQQTQQQVQQLQTKLAQSDTQVSKLNAQQLGKNQIQAIATQEFQKVKQTIATELEPLGKQFKTLMTDVKGLEKQLVTEKNQFAQQMTLLNEEMENLPLQQVETLQDQLSVFIQSVDRFRQQTNASVDEMSTRLDTLTETLFERTREQGFGQQEPAKLDLPISSEDAPR